MNRYEAYCTEDFVLDAEFQKWVRYKTDSQAAFWDNYILEFPHQANDINEARFLLEGIYVRYRSYIGQEEIETEIAGLISRIRREREMQTEVLVGEIQHEKGSIIKPLLRLLTAASVVIALGFAGWYGVNYFYKPTYSRLIEGKSLIEKINNTSQKQTISLSDGSIVVLEPDSRLGIPKTFLPGKREVYLSGEAYFKVTKDIKRPFLVYTNKLVTRVLGTRFIVKALKDAGEVSVEVKEGKVSVFRKDDFEKVTSDTKNESKGILVTPNQKIVLESEGGRISKSLSALPAVLSGAENVPRFIYKDAAVKDVLMELKNAYQVDIIFDADLLSDCTISANLSNKKLLEQLSSICEAIEAKYEVLDGKIIIYGKSCLN